MPDIKGRFTPQERKFVAGYAATGDRLYAAQTAGLAQPRTAASKMLAKPELQAEIARLQTEILYSKVLPLAVAQHAMLLMSDKTPAGAKVQAIKLAYDRTLGAENANDGKEPYEMTGDELARAVSDALVRVATHAQLVDADEATELQDTDEDDAFG